MDKRWRFYTICLLGFLAAVFFLWFKVRLFDKLEYESDLFSILQLSKDYLLGKPFLYENAYGNNMAIHNYYFTPLCAPFTLLFGGKGLFVVGFLLFLWALYLSALVLKEQAFAVSLTFLALLFSPTAFFLWDNFHFGWHAENFYYPLSIAFMASLWLKKRWSMYLSGLFLLLNREDGIVLAMSLFIVYAVFQSPRLDRKRIKKLAFVLLGGGVVFLIGILLLHAFSHGESRIGLSYARFLKEYTLTSGWTYLKKSMESWLMLCFLVLALAIVINRSLAFIVVCLIGLLPLLLINFYSGAYYFPDLKYGINWAPRLAGTYGFVLSCLLLAMAKNDDERPSFKIYLLLVTPIICAVQVLALRELPYYQHYSIGTRTALAWSSDLPKVPNKTTQNQLKKLAKQLPANYPVRMDWELFAWFEHTDFIWPNKERHAYNEAKLLILSGEVADAEPIPTSFRKIGKIGKYGIWTNPDDALNLVLGKEN